MTDVQRDAERIRDLKTILLRIGPAGRAVLCQRVPYFRR